MNLLLLISGALILLFALWRFWFFMRNPQRSSPPGEGCLAPADGYVVYTKMVRAGAVPVSVKKGDLIRLEEVTRCEGLRNKSGTLIGIFMTAFSVHHNRAPLPGRVTEKHRNRGTNNQSTARLMANIILGRRPYAKDCGHLIKNDRVTTCVETPAGSYTLTQIADKWISHIINETTVGDTLARGERFGMIRFGSQVDLFLPDELNLSLLVRPGDYVYAGRTVLAEPSKKFHFSVATEQDNQELLEHVRRNPIQMEVDYIMDRRDDFFKLHRLLEGSVALIAKEEHTKQIAACLSLLKFRGNVGSGQVAYQYITNLIKDSGRSRPLLMQRLLEYSLKTYFDTEFIVALINEQNLRARGFSLSANLLLSNQVVATLNYHEIVPVSARRLPLRTEVRTPENDRQLKEALEFINHHYRDHLLFRDLEVTFFRQMADHLPGFDRQNVVMLYENDRLRGVLIYYDPSELVRTILTRMDRTTAMLTACLSVIHKSTGLLFAPPGKGDSVKTLQVRYLAGDEPARRLLLRHAVNLAFAGKYHTVSMLVDEREPITIPGKIHFKYNSLMYLGFKKTFASQLKRFEKYPVFVDISFT